MKILVKFTLTDGRGEAYQEFDNEANAQEFYDACVDSKHFANVTIVRTK
jgi:hypothetical protein